MIQPLANLKEKHCSLPYLKDKRGCKSKGMSKLNVGEKKKNEMF